MKRFLALIMLAIVCVCFGGCSLLYTYEHNAVGAFDLGYSDKLKDAFFALYSWDGTEDGMNIVLPEDYNGAKITALGGYHGRGVPNMFYVEISDEVMGQLCPEVKNWSYLSDTDVLENCNVEYLRFNLHISKKITELVLYDMEQIYVGEYERDGENVCNVYVLTFNVTCDEDNKYFYAKDGKLYSRGDDALVEGILYEDFELLQ